MSIKYEAILRILAVLVFMDWTGFADIPTWLMLMPLWICPLVSVLSFIGKSLVLMLGEWVR